MFDLSQTVLISTFVICILFILVAFPLATYLRRRSSAPGWNYSGLVRTAQIEQWDLIGLAILVGLYTLINALNLPPLTDWLREIGILSQSSADAPDTITLTPGVLLAGMISQAIPGVIVIVFLTFRQIDIVEFFDLKWKKAIFLLLIAPTAAVASQAVFFIMEVAGYSKLLESIFGDIELQEIVRVYQKTDAASIRIMLAIMAVIIAPLVEELVFRGYIYTVCKRYSGRIAATFVTSLFFAAVHFHVPALLPLFILAVILTIAYELSGSIWVPISIHACFNGFSLILQELHKLQEI